MQNICTTFLGSIGVYFFMHEICQMKITANVKRMICSAVALALSVFAFQLSDTMTWFIVMSSVLEFVTALILFETDFRRGFSVFLFSFAYYNVIYYPVKLIIFYIRGNVNRESKQIFAEIISLLLIIFIGRLIRKNENLVKNVQKTRTRFLFIAGLCGFLDSGIIYFVDYFTREMEGHGVTAVKILNAMVNISVYLLGVFIIYIDVIQQKLLEENIIKDKYLQMSKNHYKEISNHMQQVRAIKHDMKSHMDTLEYYLKEENYEAALSYIGKMNDKRIFETKIMNLTGSQLVDAVISYTLGTHNNIRILCDGILPADLQISDYDLCTIFSNLISNAIEACGKLTESEKVIEMKIGCYQKYLVIVVCNPVEWEIDVEKLGAVTAKENKQQHGYGINNIKNSIKNLGGKLFFDVSGHIFTAKIILEMQGEELC